MRALVICPGRGSYGRDTLGYLSGRAPELLQLCDQWRADHGRPTITELDAAQAFRGKLHVAGENASLLTFACSLADRRDLADRFDVVGVMGNSMGWYTAMAVSGSLSVGHAVRLVDTMGAYQEANVTGAQIITPLTGPDWQRDPARRADIDAALAQVRDSGAGAWWSIDLGSFAILGADDAGAKALLERLPVEQRGERTFPARLPLHSAFHTPVMEPTSQRAFDELADLGFHAPEVPLVDGLGRMHRPRTANPNALRSYTLGAQVTDTYDFALSLRTSMSLLGPDVVVLLGPGNALGGPVAATLVQMGWRGMRSRADFDAVQSSDHPVLLSFGIEPQRERLTS